VRPGESFALLGNSLVVVVPRESSTSSLAGPQGLLAFERLSLADPEAVPAGVYAKGWLTREGIWPRIAPKVVPALDVRAALAAVAAGNLPAGIVYATDAASSDKVKVVLRVPAEATPDLRYYVAPVAPGSPAAAAFVTFLKGPRARAIFARHGFTPLAGA
jgi:molybdate transport system substrate-binding protein